MKRGSVGGYPSVRVQLAASSNPLISKKFFEIVNKVAFINMNSVDTLKIPDFVRLKFTGYKQWIL